MRTDSSIESLDIPSNAKIVLPPHGFIAVQAVSASDLDVVNAARVSFSKKSDWGTNEFGSQIPGMLKEDDEKVLRYLLKNRHGTPFEHTFFKFHIRAPIFVYREWHRHRIGVSINEESGRYTELAGDFYEPEAENVREQIGRPGRYTFNPVDLETSEWAIDEMRHAYDTAFDSYQKLITQGIAKELARAVLPVGIFSQMIWTCNARSLMNFISLRNSPSAMLEIRKYAEALEEIFAKHMPITHDEFVNNGRIGP